MCSPVGDTSLPPLLSLVISLKLLPCSLHPPLTFLRPSLCLDHTTTPVVPPPTKGGRGRFFIPFQIWLGEGSIHHLPVAHPNEAIVCLPNGTWAPSVIGRPMHRHTAFTLPARIPRQRGDHVRPYTLRVFGQEKACHCLLARAPQCGSDGESRQLELCSAASLTGALHGSCINYIAMARRLVANPAGDGLSSLIGVLTKMRGPLGVIRRWQLS
ncbi:unnamed protein product [Pleuronectes platessa]|uniref:Uncharacterized protein n=1 Tax=Pleuronectes platessa TaxID=8262 RepID=A0A9N7Z3J4_PLEPL|nr:unnamed protein product [Pleuronectes platessa]